MRFYKSSISKCCVGSPFHHSQFSKSETLRKKCPYSELFWSAFFPHLPAFGLNTQRQCVSCYLSVFSPNTGKCGENADQNNSKYRHLLRSESDPFCHYVHSFVAFNVSIVLGVNTDHSMFVLLS